MAAVKTRWEADGACYVPGMSTPANTASPLSDPPPAESGFDAVIAVYMRDVDRTLLRDNLQLTPEARIRRLTNFLELSERLRDAGRKLR